MTKPKPLPANATYRIKATQEAEILRKRLNALLAIPKEGSRDEVQAILAAAEKIGDKIEVETGEVKYEDDDEEAYKDDSDEADDLEDEEDSDEGDDESDYGENVAGDPSDDQPDRDSPPPYSYEAIGFLGNVPRTTKELVDNAVGRYHSEAIEWLDWWLDQNPPTPEASQAAHESYPWIMNTLASYNPPFRLEPNPEDPQRLRHEGWSSFSHHLLQGNRFESIHAIAFTLNPTLAEAYVDQSQRGEGFIPAETILDCLQSDKALLRSCGIYGLQINTQATAPLYIGRSVNISNRLREHVNKNSYGVNRFVRAAKSSSDSSQWTRGALISFPTHPPPRAILAALETSVIACHGSAVVRPGQSQHNIVDRLFLPRPPIENLPTLYNQYKAGMSFQDLGELHNVNAWYLKELFSGSPPTVRSLRNKPNTRQDFLSLLHLRLADRADVRFPRIASIELQTSVKDTDTSIQQQSSAKDEASQYAMRTRSKNERWTLKDHMVERNDPFERADNIERIGTATRDDYGDSDGDSDDQDSMAMAIEIPVAEYRQRVAQAYLQALVQELEAI